MTCVWHRLSSLASPLLDLRDSLWDLLIEVSAVVMEPSLYMALKPPSDGMSGLWLPNGFKFELKSCNECWLSTKQIP